VVDNLGPQFNGRIYIPPFTKFPVVQKVYEKFVALLWSTFGCWEIELQSVPQHRAFNSGKLIQLFGYPILEMIDLRKCMIRILRIYDHSQCSKLLE
jgi:hypothetical protein